MTRSPRHALQSLEQRAEGRIQLDLRRAVVYAVLALVALGVGHELGRENTGLDRYKVASFGCALLVLVLGTLATRSAANEIAAKVDGRAGSAAAAPLRILVQVVGYLIVLLGVLDVLGIDLSQFLVGGAVTGVVLGIAAQQTLGNFFAGLVLLIARPYTAGEQITVWSGAINGPHVGVVIDVGLLYTGLQCDDDLLRIPNSVLLASATSRGRSARVITMEPALGTPPTTPGPTSDRPPTQEDRHDRDR